MIKIKDSLKKNEVFDCIDYNINIDNRTMYYSDEIDLYSPSWIKSRMEAIYALTGDNESPVTLEITSYGGDVYGMFGAIDVINNAPTKVNTVGRGAIMSAATWILASGTGDRILAPHTTVMIHEISSLINGTSKDIIAEASHLKSLQTKMYNTFEAYSNKSSAYWKKMSKVNFYLTPNKCLDLGIINKIEGS